jgi:hypothetical protein
LEEEQNTIGPFLHACGPELERHVRITTYEDIFAAGSIEPGPLILTDFDRMSLYELEAAQEIARCMRAAAPGVIVLNEPTRSLQRYGLLSMLWHEGINPFRAVRLDEVIPEDLRYPVFIRRENEARGAETGLLLSESELRAAMAELTTAGRPFIGRLAVEYCAEKGADGFFRKYGIFRIGDQILPQHIQFSDHWVVKRDSTRMTATHVAEELDYVRTNPHVAEIKAIFDRAGVGFGRMDYSIVDGQIVVYEINLNATFPKGDKNDARQARRVVARERLIGALTALDTPLPDLPRVTFTPPEPRIHLLPTPRARLSAQGSVWRLRGQSRWLDRGISLYWALVPARVRRIIPEDFKLRTHELLGRALRRKYP